MHLRGRPRPARRAGLRRRQGRFPDRKASEKKPTQNAAAKGGKKPMSESESQERTEPAPIPRSPRMCGTEPPFNNAYWNNKKPGIYVRHHLRQAPLHLQRQVRFRFRLAEFHQADRRFGNRGKGGPKPRGTRPKSAQRPPIPISVTSLTMGPGQTACGIASTPPPSASSPRRKCKEEGYGEYLKLLEGTKKARRKNNREQADPFAVRPESPEESTPGVTPRSEGLRAFPRSRAREHALAPKPPLPPPIAHGTLLRRPAL